MTTIVIRDVLNMNRVGDEFVLEVPAATLTARELIERRVQTEVARYNTTRPEYYRGLVQPRDAEIDLNGYRLRRRRSIDWREQAAVAVEMFQANGFLLLVDDVQVDDLDSEIRLRPETTVTFLKLVPLVGG